jgi:hypothetical protein
MKKSLLIIASIATLISSCTKDDIKPGMGNQCVNPLDDPSSVFSGLRNQNNTEDDKMNECLYYTGAGIMHLLETPSYRNKLLDKSLYDSNYEALVDMFFKDPSMLQNFNDFLLVNAACSKYGITSYEDIKKQMFYENISYSPIIYFYNLKTAETRDNHMAEYIVAIGESVDVNDRIPACEVDNKNNGKVKETRIEEKDSILSKPILIVSNYTSEADNSEDDILIEENTKNYVADKYKIKYRYEKYGKSDYRESHRVAYSSGGYSGSTASGYTIKKIPANKINYLYNQDIPLPEAGRGFWLATYERDWYSSKKAVYVSNSNGAGLALYVYCRMKYSSEYYQRMFVNFQTRKTITSSSKGYLRIKF